MLMATPSAVVFSVSVWVTQDAISPVEEFHSLCGIRAIVYIWMVFPGKTSIGRFDDFRLSIW